MSTMHAAVLRGVKDLVIEERTKPEPGPSEVQVQVSAVGVCGSDVHYYQHGRIGDFVVEEPHGPRPRVGRRRDRRGTRGGSGTGGTAGVGGAGRPGHDLRAVPGGAVQPVPRHALLRDPTHRRLPRGVRHGARGLRTPRAGRHERRRRSTAGAALRRGLGQPQGRGHRRQPRPHHRRRTRGPRRGAVRRGLRRHRGRGLRRQPAPAGARPPVRCHRHHQRGRDRHRRERLPTERAAGVLGAPAVPPPRGSGRCPGPAGRSSSGWAATSCRCPSPRCRTGRSR